MGDRSRIADRLARADVTSFVGRRRECELFRSVIAAAEPEFSVLLLHGPGGVGKTTLLRQLAREAAAAGRPVFALDARNLTPNRDAVVRALGEALGAGDVVDPTKLPFPSRSVLLIDTFEAIGALDTWLRETLLPALPDDLAVVVAGRHPPALPWRTDGRWSRLARIVEVKNFEPHESAAFLASRGVDAAADPGVLEFTRGHPLALALVAGVLAQQPRTARFDPAEAPDVVARLLELLLYDVPEAVHRQALEICAVARTTTERLMIAILGDDGGRAFAWLRRQPYIESGAFGIFPHDLVRELLVADALWRDAQGLMKQARRIYGILHGYVASARGAERQRLLMDALYVTRTRPTNRRYFDWSALDDVRAEPMDSEDATWAFEVIERHEGAASASIAREWWQRQPHAFHVFRDARERRFGLLVMLDLGDADAVRAVDDPAVPAALSFVERHGPVERGEGVVQLRWWMHAESYQAVTAAINLTAMHVVSHCMTRPRMAWSFVAMAEPDFWLTHFAGVNFARVPAADYEVGGRRYGVFAHEWRVEPPADWATGAGTPMPFTGAAPLPPTLDETTFRNAVRQALRDYTRPSALQESPLRAARCLTRPSGAPASAETIRRALRETADALKGNPRDAKLHRAIWLTYFEPLATQEAVAERLALPFSTYRHHLGRAVDHVIDSLWRLERLGRKLSLPDLPD
jgi:hypothetical protein